ncbi:MULTISPECIES: LysR family transcriptional regulator [unclassified Mesorhizobium]|uniref:LysR family transcriptional regulator n=1 Tax=unclassified Mesorhizobium TaxID=325217 RepID=UPI001FDA5B58|nr:MULTISPECIES: LysR family transcriptional regulator [unclassified Mesorhizobium]WJI69591.1 LysR family transcriptional regulator [Mesorhizobium sp. C399B]
MSRMDDFEAFIAIVEHGSLTTAAHRLNRSLQSVSRSLAALEESVGVELIHRTTRRSTPSEVGAAFFNRIKPAVDEINDARLQAINQRSEPAGVLRIGAPVLFGPNVLMPVIAEYMRTFPRSRSIFNFPMDLPILAPKVSTWQYASAICRIPT